VYQCTVSVRLGQSLTDPLRARLARSLWSIGSILTIAIRPPPPLSSAVSGVQCANSTFGVPQCQGMNLSVTIRPEPDYQGAMLPSCQIPANNDNGYGSVAYTNATCSAPGAIDPCAEYSASCQTCLSLPPFAFGCGVSSMTHQTCGLTRACSHLVWADFGRLSSCIRDILSLSGARLRTMAWVRVNWVIRTVIRMRRRTVRRLRERRRVMAGDPEMAADRTTPVGVKQRGPIGAVRRTTHSHTPPSSLSLIHLLCSNNFLTFISVVNCVCQHPMPVLAPRAWVPCRSTTVSEQHISER
jgi:hypothetical protein